MKMPDKNGGSDYRYAYQGKFAEKDDETGLLSFEARMYDARIGRWLTVDPAGQFHSPYLGMGNNPILYTDSDGRWVQAATAVLGGTINAGISIYNQGGFANADYKRVGIAFAGGATGNIYAAVATNAVADVVDQVMYEKEYNWTQTAGNIVGTYTGAGVTKMISKVGNPFINKAVEQFKFKGKIGDVRAINNVADKTSWFTSEFSGGLFGGAYFGPKVQNEVIDPVATYLLPEVTVIANSVIDNSTSI